jgi:hypothetical protein
MPHLLHKIHVVYIEATLSEKCTFITHAMRLFFSVDVRVSWLQGLLGSHRTCARDLPQWLEGLKSSYLNYYLPQFVTIALEGSPRNRCSKTGLSLPYAYISAHEADSVIIHILKPLNSNRHLQDSNRMATEANSVPHPTLISVSPMILWFIHSSQS